MPSMSDNLFDDPVWRARLDAALSEIQNKAPAKMPVTVTIDEIGDDPSADAQSPAHASVYVPILNITR